ncbi:MAG: hypothetical protein QF903_06925 [Planctomycetota bacterium]|jgi:hypothetical protein|nr:hypothetical protein [Planctomycetota bacterium]
MNDAKRGPDAHTWIKAPFLGLCLLTLAACGGGGGGGGGGAASAVTGSWFGTEELTDGSLHPVRITVDADQTITEVLLDGAPTGLTGSITHSQDRIYDYTLSDGTEGGFWLSETGTHVVFCDDEWNFGVIQKGGSSAGNYSLGDITGSSFAGYTVVTDAAFEIAATGTSTCTVHVDGSFEGAFDGGAAGASTFENLPGGELQLDDSNYGRFLGSYSDSTGDIGTISAIMSPDKKLIGTWASPGFFPEDCSFSVWTAD